MFAYLKNKCKIVRKNRLIEDESGTTAIEFAILGIPFLALLFGIIELAVLFFISSTTQHALETVARKIRTGEFQTSGGGAAEFKTRICTAMTGVGACDKLRVDVISSATGRFSTLVLPESPEPIPVGETEEEKDAREAAAPALPADNYTVTSGGDVVIVRVQYVHTLTLPTELTRLANSTGNTHIITHTTAFKNEPFGP